MEQLVRRIANEVAHQMRERVLPAVKPAELIQETLAAAVRAGWGPDGEDGPDSETLRHLVRDVAHRQWKSTERAWEQQFPLPSAPLKDRVQKLLEEERRHREEQSAGRVAAEATARRKRVEEAAHQLLEAAGLPVGRTEVKITTLLLHRGGEVTETQMRKALKAYEDAYEQRVQSFKKSGGQTRWPTPDAVIASLFGRP